MAFRENLKSELEFKNMKVKELSEKTGISRRTIDQYLSAAAKMPSAENAVKIAQALGVSVEYLVTGKPSAVSDVDIAREIQLFQKYRPLIAKMETLPKNAQECLDFFVDKMPQPDFCSSGWATSKPQFASMFSSRSSLIPSM